MDRIETHQLAAIKINAILPHKSRKSQVFATRFRHAAQAAPRGVVKPCPMVRRDGRLAMPLTNIDAEAKIGFCIGSPYG